MRLFALVHLALRKTVHGGEPLPELKRGQPVNAFSLVVVFSHFIFKLLFSLGRAGFGFSYLNRPRLKFLCYALTIEQIVAEMNSTGSPDEKFKGARVWKLCLKA